MDKCLKILTSKETPIEKNSYFENIALMVFGEEKNMVYTNYRQGHGNSSGISNNNYSIGMRYYKEKKYAKAIEYLEKDIKSNEYSMAFAYFFSL